MGQPQDTRHIEGSQGPLSVPDGTLQPGQVLQSRYRILGIIGVGGMGAVYQARDLHFPNVTRLCAVKEMINMAQDQKLREQTIHNFEREAEILATLNHPSIPQIYDYFSFGDRAYLVLEFIQGRDLEAILTSTEGFLPVEQVRQWGVEICEVLGYLHNHQPEPIVFRDMKPSNVMIDHHRKIRLIDFGIAKMFQAGQTGTMIGTEGYSPPEQYKGLASPAADIYALGATLHHLLTRRDPRLEPPFSFDQKPIKEYNSSVPDALAAVVMRALSYDPEQRYSSADAMRQSLEAAGTTVVAAPAHMPINMPTGAAAPIPAQGMPPLSAHGGVPAPALVSSMDNVLPIWSFQVEDAVRSTPLVQDGVLYVGSYDNNLWALDAKDGSLRWKFATEGGIGASPTYSNGIIYIGSSDHRMYAVDARTGRLAWSHKTEGKIFTKVAAAVGAIYFGADDGKLYALKPGMSSARELWTYPILAPIRSSPVVEGDQLFFGCDGGEFLCVDLSGEMQWRFETRRRIMSTPLVHEGIVYLGSDNWYFYALEMRQGYVSWRYKTRGAIVSSAAFSEGKVYFGSADGFVYALDAMSSGREVWKYEVKQPVTSSPFVYREVVYVGAVDGAIYALHAKSGDLLWRFQSKGPILSSPYIVDDVVYVGSDDHHVYALQA